VPMATVGQDFGPYHEHFVRFGIRLDQVKVIGDLYTPQAFNPAELLLAALSACMLKSIERVMPILKFELRGVEVRVHGVR